MSNFFLFAHDLSEEGCLSLCLDEKGHLKAPLQFREYSEIRALQINNKTIVLCPTNRFSIHYVELPRLSESKINAALPYSLEDKLPENVDLLHFAFDKAFYSNGQYLVIVGEKNYLIELIDIFANNVIKIDLFTVDFFALNEGEAALIKDYILSNNHLFQGALSLELAPLYFKNWQTENLYHFRDSPPFQQAEIILKEKHEASYMWLAKRLLKKKTINLSQGTLQYKKHNEALKKWYKLSLGMLSLWFLSFLAINSFMIYHNNQKIKEKDKAIASIYHQFFPAAKQVISPKFRISQLINNNQSQSNLVFWALLEKLVPVFREKQLSLEQLRFQNQTLILKLLANNFESLEQLQTSLQSAKIKVKQTEAQMHDNKVVATLELSL